MPRIYSIERDGDSVEAWIPSQLRFPTLVIGVVLLVYAMPALLGGTPVIIEGVREFVAGMPPDAARLTVVVLYAAWLTVGVGPAVAGLLVVGYQFLGWERVRVDERGLSVKREVLGLGRRRRYPPAAADTLRLMPPLRMRQWFVSTGTVAFDAREATHRFGASLSRDEAADVLRALTAGPSRPKPEAIDDDE